MHYSFLENEPFLLTGRRYIYILIKKEEVTVSVYTNFSDAGIYSFAG